LSMIAPDSLQVPQTERDALIVLYNSTVGANWADNTGWMGEVGTECDWYGVTCSSGSVSEISMSFNNLSGSIPSELGILTNLTDLDLSSNSLGGSIPSELGNMTNLTRLWLYSNALSGSIPAELGNLTNLDSLWLDGNSLGGSIPAELGNLTNLTRLYLNNNSFSGSIPAELGNLTNLTRLSLYDNTLSGSIPAELGNLTKLTSLYLYNNSLSGSIPAELGNLTDLIVLYLNNNSLTGPLPQWLSDLSIPNLNITDAFTATPIYEPTVEWPSPYNGVTPDSSFGLAFNNIGVLNASDAKIYVCLRIFTEGLPSSVNDISQFDMGLEVVSLSEVTVQITKFREFNAIGALNEDGQTPDCSGKFETTTGVYTDIIQTSTSVLETTWTLIDSTNLILKLDSFKELTAN